MLVAIKFKCKCNLFEGDEIVGDDDAQKRKMREERFTLEASQTGVTSEYELKK